MNYLCYFGKHKYVSELRTYDLFNTKYSCGTVTFWQAHFLKCKHCSHRKFFTDHYGKVHKGLDTAKHLWLDKGYISENIRNPKRKKPSQEQTISNTHSDRINHLILKALNTNSESEAVSCLNKARREYNAKS